MRTDPYDDLCLSCGYDLRGLKLPRACPECGEVRDPEQDEKKARDWFAKFRLSPIWPIKLCDTPPGLWYLLSDAKSQRTAQRRRFYWLWLPAILMIFFVCAASLISIEYDVIETYYSRLDPHGSPKRINERVESFGLFRHNLGPFNRRMYASQQGWIEKTEYNFRRISIGIEGDNIEPYIFGVPALVGALLGFYSSHYLLIILASRNSRELSSEKQPARAVSAILAPMLSLSLWAWFALWVYDGLEDIVDAQQKHVLITLKIKETMVLLSMGNWILTCLGGWYLLLRLDDAQQVVKWRLLVSLLLVAISVGFPLGLVWLMVRLF